MWPGNGNTDKALNLLCVPRNHLYANCRSLLHKYGVNGDKVGGNRFE
jgi:hypothetical protein